MDNMEMVKHFLALISVTLFTSLIVFFAVGMIMVMWGHLGLIIFAKVCATILIAFLLIAALFCMALIEDDEL